MRRWMTTFATTGILLWATPLTAGPVCQPILTVKEVNFSTVTNLRRYWSATLLVDASQCKKSTGLVAFGFVRGAENAPDVEFLEPFIWRAGETKVRVEFWADEAVDKYWLADVAPCLCRGE